MRLTLRRTLACWNITATALVLGAMSGTAQALAPDQLYEQLSPSIWIVKTLDHDGLPLGQGSAVVIGPSTMITNCHVLAKAKSLQVHHGDVRLPAELESPDVDRDLCTIHVEGLKAPAVSIAALSAARVGEHVIAIGAPRGLELTLSDGLISALSRQINSQNNLIQISVPIQHGSSGGGLFNDQGELLGITSSGIDGSGNLNFAIPAEYIGAIKERAKLALAARAQQQPVYATQIAPPAAPSLSNTPVQSTRPAITGKVLSDLTNSLYRYESRFGGDRISLAIEGSAVRVLDMSNGEYADGNFDLSQDRFCIQSLNNPRLARLNGCYEARPVDRSSFEARQVGGDVYAYTLQVSSVAALDRASMSLGGAPANVQRPSFVVSSNAPIGATRVLHGPDLLQHVVNYPEVDAYSNENQFIHLSLSKGALRIKDSLHSGTAQGFYTIDAAAQTICFSGLTTAESQTFNGCYSLFARDATNFELRRVDGRVSLAYRVAG